MHYVFGECYLDTERYILSRADSPVRLRAKVFDVLVYLITHRDRVISKDELRDQLWPGQFVGDAALSSCIKAVRRAVGDNGRDQRVVATVHGRGYRFIASVEERPSPAPRERGKQPERYHRTYSAQVTTRQSSFVGRTQQLDHLADCWQDAIAGQPRVVLIEGEAGIGKTRLLKELESHTRQQDVQVCYGRCYEDLALPYLPFVESLLALLEQEFGDVTPSLDADVEVIRWLRHPHKMARFTADSSSSIQVDQAKLRLFLAVSRTTITLAQRRPLCFLLDDLHWADHPSLELFGHLVFTIADAAAQGSIPLLIAATYRPPEPSSRLARFIPRFEREAMCQTYELISLDESEIAAYIQGMDLGPPSHQLVAMIRDVTQGNPLFMQEILHHLLQKQALHTRHGYVVTTTALADLRLPTHIAASIAIRLTALSKDCQRVLTLAAFLGERISLQVLSAISGFEEEVVLDALEEAMHQHLLLSEDQDFQFAHPLIRHVLYQAPSAARRQRLHQRVAQALESLYATDLEAHTLEIAHHLLGAGSVVAVDTVMAYTRRAGDQAFTMFAWSSAARYYEAALAIGASSGKLSAQECAELHYRAGLAHHRNQDVGPCLDHYDQAIAGYRCTGDMRGVAQGLMEKTEIQYTLAAVPLGTLAEVQPLQDALDVLGDREPGLRGRLLVIMAQTYRSARQLPHAMELANQALELGQRHEDDYLCARASSTLALASIQSLRVWAALEHWEHAMAAARRTGDLWLQGWPLQRMPLGLILVGRMEDATAVALEACDVTRTTQAWGDYSLALAHLAYISVATGDFTATQDYAQEAMQMVYRSGYPWGGSRALFALACAHALRGAWSEAEHVLDMLVEPGRVFRQPGTDLQAIVRALRQLVRAQAEPGDAPMAPGATDLMQAVGTDSYALAPFCALVECADLMAEPAMAEAPYRRLAQAFEQDVCFTTGWTFLIPRVLGVAAMLNGWWDKAEAAFHTAIDAATRAGARPELGRTSLDYARMLTIRGRTHDQHRALELAQQAGSILHELGMHPFAACAERLVEELQVALSLSPPPRRTSVEHPGTRAGDVFHPPHDDING